MAKVAYNDDFGGFELPREGVIIAREISGDRNWGGCILKGEECSDGSISEYDYGFINSSIPRHDPVLVEVIEMLGDRVAPLRLQELPSGTKYFIDEHGGAETVETVDTIEWIIAP